MSQTIFNKITMLSTRKCTYECPQHYVTYTPNVQTSSNQVMSAIYGIRTLLSTAHIHHVAFMATRPQKHCAFEFIANSMFETAGVCLNILQFSHCPVLLQMMRTPLHYAHLLYDGNSPITELLAKCCGQSGEVADVVRVNHFKRITCAYNCYCITPI